MKVILMITTLVVCGCTTTSGVIPLENNTFLLTRSEKGFATTGARVKADSLRDAISFCQSRHQTMKIVSATSADMRPLRADAQAEVVFTCVNDF